MTRQLTFGFSDSVLIPANGGYVLAGSTGVNGPFWQLKNADALFDPSCNNLHGAGRGDF